MELQEFGLLADENIHPDLIVFIRQQNMNVVSVKEEQLSGTTDEDLISRAERQSLVILTHDSDFGKIVFTNKGIHVGIVYLRPGHISPQFHVHTLNALLQTSLELTIPFLLVAERAGDTIRIRKRLL
jgi:predicted nuclease of predicted toxin-antitoxin system